mmetsp:Transcript_26269/g.51572  ORF Transcript_26269/g.51572 Transcript_26269/m.51572 type:complete len:144 (-) Transcript_26269:1499-1930(-)
MSSLFPSSFSQHKDKHDSILSLFLLLVLRLTSFFIIMPFDRDPPVFLFISSLSLPSFPLFSNSPMDGPHKKERLLLAGVMSFRDAPLAGLIHPTCLPSLPFSRRHLYWSKQASYLAPSRFYAIPLFVFLPPPCLYVPLRLSPF